ncbi:DUF397 domain-containing protein [Actinoallomurus acanthiterrae]
MRAAMPILPPEFYDVTWRKSTRSQTQSDQCVEVTIATIR